MVISASPARSGEPAVSFRNDVMAVLSKAGCNQGTCHGNANGKGGFKLSLRGEDPEADLITLTRGSAARRVNTADPERSLLLRKPTMELAHEGGRRLLRESDDFRVLRDWIAAGLPADGRGTPRLTTLTVSPPNAVVASPAHSLSLTATATFSDGSTRDVTRLAVYEPSDAAIAITADGRVTPAMTVPGGTAAARLTEGTVIVRYLNRQVPIPVAFLPERQEFVWSPPVPESAVTSELDRRVFARLRALQVNPSALADDSTFVRRVTLDLTGVIPTEEEAREFVESDDPRKRARLIDRLIDSQAFAEWWAIKWSDLLRNEEKVLDRKGVENFHAWIRGAIARDMPLTEFAHAILSSRGSTYASPASNFYRAMRDPIMRAESAAQVFLGVRLQCAKCHNHPFDLWTQNDYYGWVNVFARIDYKILENNRTDRNDTHQFDGEQIVYLTSRGGFDDPRTGEPVEPQLLRGMMARSPESGSGAAPEVDVVTDATHAISFAPTVSLDADPLEALAEWVVHPDNRQFARVQANRIWAELTGRGIVEPVDDFRATNPASNPELLEWLTDEFLAHGASLKHTVRTICNSRTYQLSSEPNESNADDHVNFSRATVRRLTAEQLLDSLCRATEASVRFVGYPRGMMARQIAGVHALNPRYDPPSPADRFLTTFGKPPRLQACACERSHDSTLAQTFQLISGQLVHELLTFPDNRLARLHAADLTSSETIERMYWATVSRAPTAHERETIVELLTAADVPRSALEDVFWGLLNSSEFLLRR
jgi:hypothetical protein